MKIHLFLAWIQKRTKEIIWQSRIIWKLNFWKVSTDLNNLVKNYRLSYVHESKKKWRHIYSLLRLHENSRPPQTTKPKFFCDNIKLFCSNMGQFKLTNLIQVDPWKSCCFSFSWSFQIGSVFTSNCFLKRFVFNWLWKITKK